MVGSSSTSSSRRFFVKLGIFLALIAVLDAGAGALLRHFYFRQNSGLNWKTTYAIEESAEDVLVLGSSRAQAHYDPVILETELGGTCWNAGRDGQSFLYSAAVLAARMQRRAPRTVIVDIVPADFYRYSRNYDRLAVLLPYYARHDAVRPIVELRSRYERVKLLSRIYPFNSLVLQIFKYNLVSGAAGKGFVPVNGRLTLPIRPFEERFWVRNGPDEVMYEWLDRVIASCRREGVDLVLVVSPVYEGRVPGRAALERIRSSLAGTGFAFLDYSEHPDFVDADHLFRDQDHLNAEGARHFTGLLAADLGMAATARAGH